MLAPIVSDQLTRAEIGYAGSTAMLILGLWLLYRAGGKPVAAEQPPVDGPTVLAAPPVD